MSKIIVNLPQLHSGQQEMLRLVDSNRKTVICMGRRSGKTRFLAYLCARSLVRSQKIGFFAPQTRHLNEPFTAMMDALSSLGDMVKANRSDWTIAIPSLGAICTMIPADGDENRSRGKEFDLVAVDEAGFCEDRDGQFERLMRMVVAPALLTTGGKTVLSSTPNGLGNYFHKCFNDPSWAAMTAPSAANPFIPSAEIEKLRLEMDSRAFRQEILAEFLDLSEDTWFRPEHLYQDGEPIEAPIKVDCVFAVADTALKSGSNNDATAVVWFAYSQHKREGVPKLTILDYQLIQMDAYLLMDLMPSWVKQGEELAAETQARLGFIGIAIEDAASGIVLNQAAKANRLPVIPIESGWTAKGKDERSLLCSTFYVGGNMKITRHANDKIVTFKGVTKNHLLSQFLEFRVGDKLAYRRSDDALDALCYGMLYADSDLATWG